MPTNRLDTIQDTMPPIPEAAIASGECFARNIASANCMNTRPAFDSSSGTARRVISMYFRGFSQ